MPADTPVLSTGQYAERLDGIRQRCEAATPGPWFAPRLADGVRHLERNEDWYFDEVPKEYNLPGRQEGDGGQRDGAFIAAAREDIPFLLAALAAAESRVRELTETGEWALDLLDMYDKRLASIDGAHKVYTPIHEAGKAKARRVLGDARSELHVP